MTNNSPLDEHIKEKLGKYSPDVPPHIWENIVAEKDKRRPVWFWFSSLNKNLLFLFFGIVLAGAGIILYKNVLSPENTNTKTDAINGHLNKNNEKANSISAEKNNEIINNISPENNVEKLNPAGNILTSGNQITETNNTNIADKNITTTSKTIAAGINKKRALLSTSENRKNNFPLSSEDNNTIAGCAGKKIKRMKGASAISYKTPETVTDDITDINSNDLLLKRLLLNLDLIRSEKTYPVSIKKINNPHLNIPCPEAEKNAAGNKKYLEIYGAPDYAFRSITDTGNSTYLQKRKESTSFSSAFSVGLRYTRVFGNGMSFRTGINYSQINEKFKFAEGNIIQVVYIVNGNGDTTGSYTTTGTRYKTTYNKFRTLDVPLLVGYELGNGRIHANFNAGAIINLYSWQQGDVLDTALQPVSITTGKTASPYQFKTNVGIGFLGAVSVYYKLTDKWHIFAEPYFRYNFSPASKASLTLKQKYNTAGLRLGVRLDF